jgi:hypothetical protein
VEETGEAGAEVRRFFVPTLAAYVLTVHDTQTKVVDCRRAAASKDIRGGNTDGGDRHASVTSALPLQTSIISTFLSTTVKQLVIEVSRRTPNAPSFWDDICCRPRRNSF